MNLNEAAQNNVNDLAVFEEVTLNQKERDYIKKVQKQKQDESFIEVN